jgi:hypothetical protein
MNSEFWNIFQWNSIGFSDRNCSKSGWVVLKKSTTEWTTVMETETKSKISAVKFWPNLNPVYIFGL